MMRMVMLVLFLPLSVACQSAETCGSWAAANDGQAHWGQCGDDRLRDVTCEGVVRGVVVVPGKPVTCTCVVGGVVGKKFELTDPGLLMTLESATKIANDACGWHLSR